MGRFKEIAIQLHNREADAEALLRWTRELLTNLEMDPTSPNYSGRAVHEQLLAAISEYLEGGNNEE